MVQYKNIKDKYPDSILMFQMGDFYEMFYEDANQSSSVLGITLTSRDKNKENKVPMCGVPLTNLATSVKKLLDNNLKVAVCDQIENPEYAKGIVNREVTKLLTPGMVFDPETLDKTKQNFLAAFDDTTVSFIDTSTGDNFYYEVAGIVQVRSLFDTFKPVELVTSKDQKNTIFKNVLVSSFDMETPNLDKNKYTCNGMEIASTKKLVGYIWSMKHAISTLKPLYKRGTSYMGLKSNTRQHLEFFKTYNNDVTGSLFNTINKTKTPGGARKLREFLNFPLMDGDLIKKRHDKVEEYLDNKSLLGLLRKSLSSIGEIERKLIKICSGNYAPRDFISIANSIDKALEVLNIQNFRHKDQDKLREIVDTIFKTVEIDFCSTVKDGGFIKPEASIKLANLIKCDQEASNTLKRLEERERQKLRISSLKIKFNNVFGYYIEVTNTHKNKIPGYYIRKQTLVNSERYTITELKKIEEEVLLARSKRVELELSMLDNLRMLLHDNARVLMEVSDLISRIDVFSSLAWLALENNYVRPKLSEDKICVVNLRHPVVELYSDIPFVPNTFEMNRSGCMLITGPNMAGKSTVMRQFAICSILCQMGSFIPATSATLCVFDRVYTRIGASDSLSEGLSTFMVEMKDTASMLDGATSKSLLILDEVGRGTSTFDGMSLAQAILEHLVSEVRATTFFATHYHELTFKIGEVINKHMGIEENGNTIRFLYTLLDGVCSKSYGVEVAKLAGIPEQVTSRASEILSQKVFK